MTCYRPNRSKTGEGRALMVQPETLSHFCGLQVTVKREVVEGTSQKLEYFERGGREKEL